MAAVSKCVYCYQFGSDDCYKIGVWSKNPNELK